MLLSYQVTKLPSFPYNIYLIYKLFYLIIGNISNNMAKTLMNTRFIDVTKMILSVTCNITIK